MPLHLEALSGEGRALWPLLPSCSDGYYLAGGTALALQLNHRQSIDFDFFSETHIPRTQLSHVETVFTGHAIAPQINNRDELTVFIDGVNVSFISYPFPLLMPLVREEGLQLLSAKEIAVTKAYTIGRRGEWKDYVDLYMCLLQGVIPLSEIIEYAQKKYGTAFNDRLFLEQLAYLDDIDETQLLTMNVPLTREEALDYFKRAIGNLHIVG